VPSVDFVVGKLDFCTDGAYPSGIRVNYTTANGDAGWKPKLFRSLF